MGTIMKSQKDGNDNQKFLSLFDIGISTKKEIISWTKVSHRPWRENK